LIAATYSERDCVGAADGTTGALLALLVSEEAAIGGLGFEDTDEESETAPPIDVEQAASISPVIVNPNQHLCIAHGPFRACPSRITLWKPSPGCLPR
jgi:hypothetical protein